jgi:glycosyltransferase involved in cell wall biosynthesis
MKNEAHNIGPFLQSVKGCFDEIHITDTGSTDGSLEFIEKINKLIEDKDPNWEGYPKIQLHHFDWVDDFAAARNYSFIPATADYICWMDLDDSLSDAKAFIHWRDTVLHAGHYWVALYNYAFKPSGEVECQFIRERVIKRNHGFGWEYAVHEGIIQKENLPFWPQRASSWWINHRRTDEDRKQDESRNIKIFEKQDIEKLHPRMWFYYGKELFENGRPQEAGKPLLDAIKSGKLDVHDSVICIQYCAQSALAAKAYTQAVDILMNGLRLWPSRAEYYCMLGDVYISLNQLSNAVLAYKNAMNCEPNDGGGTVVIYGHAYEEYPLEQLTRVFFSMGDIGKANECVARMVKTNHKNAKAFQEEMVKMKDLNHVRTDLPKTDDIIITCPPGGPVTDWDENTLKTTGHGGSETAAIEVARWLKRKTNRRVKIFQSRVKHDVMPSGVEYHPIQDLQGYVQNVEPAAHIAWRHPSKLTHGKSYIWCHDLQMPGAERTENYDKIIALSQFHKDYLMEMNGVPADKVMLAHNGINPDDFEVTGDKDPLKVVFSSSPDRGLTQSIDIVKKAREISGLDIKLHTFYGFANMRKGGHADWADRIEAKIKENAEFVTMHGQVDKKTLMKHFREAAVWLYPSDFIESNCITAYEAMSSHTWPIFRQMGALPFTLKPALDKGLCDMLTVEPRDAASFGIWANTLVEAIIGKKWEKMDFTAESFSWEKVADKFISEMQL